MYIYGESAPGAQRQRQFSLEGLGRAPIKWMDTPEQQTFLERVLAAHIARSTRHKKRSPLPDLPATNLSPVAGTRIGMRTDAAIAAGKLLAAANRALNAAKAAGERDALKTIRISATSGYRPRAHQEGLWRKYFKKKYYDRTVTARAKLPGSPHGDAAVSYMVKYVAPKIAAPGFSNHQAGLAIDFKQHRTKGNEIQNSTDARWVSAWQSSWFFRWLNKNAARFGFYPYLREPWHWTYRPVQPSVRPAAPSPAVPAQASNSSVLGSLFQQFRDAVRQGKITLAVGLALLRGIRDENELTNLIFFARHPERQGRKLRREEPQFKQLSKEWLDIRDRLVRPALRASSARHAMAASSTSAVTPDMPQGPFGTLTAVVPGRPPFNYVFTPDDVLWTARFIVGEAGGRDDPDNRAVIWAMINRYAFFTHKYYPTFHQFIRAYSTPLQPVLKSWTAAKRHMHKPEFVRRGDYYKPPHNDIPRGQLRPFLQLQKKPWTQLPSGARSLTYRALSGQIPNPIGTASEFGSTYVYFHDNYGRYPRDDEWHQYTNAYARRKGWIWIGPVSGLNQKKNAFFKQKSVQNLPPDTVRVVPPS